MQTTITYGVKFSFEEIKEYFKLKNIEWKNNYESKLKRENLLDIFMDIPEKFYIDNEDHIILGFDIFEKNYKNRDLEFLDLGNLKIESVICDKLNCFLKNNSLDKEKSFFFTCNF